jgi:hypothetical protein
MTECNETHLSLFYVMTPSDFCLPLVKEGACLKPVLMSITVNDRTSYVDSVNQRQKKFLKSTKNQAIIGCVDRTFFLLSRQKYDHGKSLMEVQSLFLGVSGIDISIFYTLDAQF